MTENQVFLLTTGAVMTEELKEITFYFFVFCMTERRELSLALRQNLSLIKLIRRQSYAAASCVSGFSVSETDTLIVVKNTGNANVKYKTENWKATSMSKVVSEMRAHLVLRYSKQLLTLPLGFFSAPCLVAKLTVLSSNSETSTPGAFCKQNFSIEKSMFLLNAINVFYYFYYAKYLKTTNGINIA